MKKVPVLVILLSIFSLPSFAFAIPVVPGAYGFGMDTRAAYGCGTNPTIIHVNKLTDTGEAGTLRGALEASGPRVVVFDTSGTIVLDRDIDVFEPCVTIAGQTAPAPGITIKGFGIAFQTHDVLMQHLRIRPGDGPPLIELIADHDGAIIYNNNAYNVVFDHNSLSWAQDKNTLAGSLPANANVTYWRNIISEALYHAKNVIYSDPSWPGSLGLLLAQSYVQVPANISVIGNLLAHNSDRNPEIQGPVNAHFINNVVYDWGKDYANPYPWASFIYVQSGTGPKVDIIGNKYIAGPSPVPNAPLYAIGTYGLNTGVALYMNDNAVDQTRQQVVLYQNSMAADPTVLIPPVSLSGITVLPSSGIESFVLGNAGARPAFRDSIDTRIASEVTSRTGNVISSQDQVGGWANVPVNVAVANPPSNPHAISATGYTNLEDWLHNLANAVEGSGTVTPPPPTPPSPPSPSGTRIPTSSSITDNSGNTWTIGGSNAILKNGLQAGAGAGTILLYYQNNFYTFATDNNWWQWNGSSWTSVGPNDPSVQAVSADGTEIPPASQIVDNSSNIWSVSGSTILRNGAQAGGGSGTILLWSNTNKIYVFATDNAWWQWNGTNWTRLGTSKPNMGDLNKDHIVNSLDWSYMNSKWFGTDATADLNHDGVVNAIDFSLMNANWLKNW